RQVDVVHPVVGQLVLPGTDVQYSIKTTSSKSVHPGPAAGDLYVTDSNYTSVIANENYQFDDPKLIASPDNETEFLSGNKSFFLKAILKSNNVNISPVIDLQRLSLITIANALDSPAATGSFSINDSDIDYNTVLSASGNVVFTATTSAITSTDATVSAALSQIQKGKFIQVTGTSNNNVTARVSSVSYTPSGTPKITIVLDATLVNESPGSTTVIQYERFIDERAPKLGSASCKYLNRRMILAQPFNGVKVMFGAVKPQSVNIDVYYKIGKV